MKNAEQIWEESVPISHPKAQSARDYFQNRGLNSDKISCTTRLHPSLPYYENETCLGNFPTIVCKISDSNDKVIGLQRIYVTNDGNKAPVGSVKKILGIKKNGLVRLDEAKDEVQHDPNEGQQCSDLDAGADVKIDIHLPA